MQQATQPSTSQLEEAFEVFNRLSGELDDSYTALQTRVSALSGELASKRRERLREQASKDRTLTRLTSLVSVLPGGLLIVDGNDIVHDANPRALELLGDNVKGQNLSTLLNRLSAPGQSSASERLLKSGVYISLQSRPLERRGERVILITDVSQTHALQKQLQSKRRLTALGEMAAQLAHQVRTPLSSTTLYLSQLARQDLPQAKREHIAAKVNSQLRHMGHIIDSMLSFVRGASPTWEKVLLADVLNTFENNVRATLEARDARLSLPKVDDSLAVLGAREDLAGALGNLAMNAVEAAASPVHIELWVGARNARYLQIRVRDNGPGIAEEIQERIFDPFFTTRANGTGLGLAVVEQTVSAHGGNISVHSNPNGGTEFLIELPIYNPLQGEQHD